MHDRFILRIKEIALLCLAVTMASCSGGSSVDLDSLTDEDFVGAFTLRDHSCTYDPIDRITIQEQSETTVSVTITDPGDTGLMAGDIFFGDIEGEGTSTTVNLSLTADFACTLARIVTEEDATEGQEVLAIDIERGDLEAICTDTASVDEVCYIAFAPQ